MAHDLKSIHKKCGWHEEAISSSVACGCFYCKSIFPSADIFEWVDEPEKSPRGAGRTALCPKCGIDSVLPESDEYEITSELLDEMNQRWFS